MSTVHKSQRKQTKFDVLDNACKIRAEVENLLLRNLGVKAKRWNFYFFGKNTKLTKEEADELNEICKYYRFSDDEISEIKYILDEHMVSQSDIEKVNKIMENHQVGDSVLIEFPQWLIDDFRDTLLSIIRKMISNIIHANSIYATSEEEYYQRRQYQNSAIGDCYDLRAEFHHVISALPVDVNKYVYLSEMIEHEINLLKQWRKSDNKTLKTILNKKQSDA